jgi:hypothetical protein
VLNKVDPSGKGDIRHAIAYGMGQQLMFNKGYIRECTEIKKGIELQHDEDAREKLKDKFTRKTRIPQYLHLVINA